MRLLHSSSFTPSIGRRTTEICPPIIPSSSVRSTKGKWTLVESGFCLKLDKNYLIEYKVAEIGFSSGKWAFNLCMFTAIPVPYYYFSVTWYSQISQEVRDLPLYLSLSSQMQQIWYMTTATPSMINSLHSY